MSLVFRRLLRCGAAPLGLPAVATVAGRFQSTGPAGSVKVHAIEVEGGPNTPVIFVHGLYGSCANFRSIMKGCSNKTKADRPYASMDLRNHGSSGHVGDMSVDGMADDIAHLLDQRGYSSATLIGHSLGGRAVMAAALKYPELVHKLMVVDMAPSNLGKASEVSFGEATRVGKAMAALPLESIESRPHADELLAAEVEDPAVRAFALQNLVGSAAKGWGWRCNLDVLNESREQMSRFELAGGVAAPYSGPTLFLRGLQSDYVDPERHGPVIRALFPLATIDSMDTGHWVHAEKPTEFIGKVIEFTAD